VFVESAGYFNNSVQCTRKRRDALPCVFASDSSTTAFTIALSHAFVRRLHDHPGAENVPLFPPGSGHESMPFTSILIRPSIIVLGDRWYTLLRIHARIGAEQPFRSARQPRVRLVHFFTSRPSSPSRPPAQDKPRTNPTPSRLHSLPPFLFLHFFYLNFSLFGQRRSAWPPPCGISTPSQYNP